MLFRVIDKSELAGLVRGFTQSYEVVGPVKHGGTYVFDEVGSHPEDLCIDYPTTLLSPKEYLMPPRQRLFSFDTGKNVVTDDAIPVVKRVLFGLHACDINGIKRLDAVFDESEYADPYYQRQRAATLIVGVSCMPTEHCCCNLWGTGEATSGYDMFLHDIGDSYLVSVVSVEAAEILNTYTDNREATAADSALFKERTKLFEAAQNEMPSTNELPMLMDAFYNDALWDDIGGRCLSCGSCAYVCPTCHCFDMEDVLSLDGSQGERDRIWDACTNPPFSVVAGGYNFHATPASRVRNRFYHKFLGYLSKHDHVMCVGCGRCEAACKAGIGPKAVIAALQREAEVGKEAQAR